MANNHQALIVDIGQDRVSFMEGQWGGRRKIINEMERAGTGKPVKLTPHSPVIIAGVNMPDVDPFISAYALVVATYGGRFECKQMPDVLKDFLHEWDEDYIHHMAHNM